MTRDETRSKEEQWVLEEKYGGFVNPHFEEDRKRLAAGEPVAYVIGSQPFLDLKIFLDSKPLIPRPETEWWTEQLLTHVGRVGRLTSNMALLDLCAGSGAIGCAMLATLPEAHVYFGEIDSRHEATIRKNIEMNNLDLTRAHIGIGDLFAPFPTIRFDIIACNPPYVPRGRELPVSVADFEPAAALFAGADGLELMRRIAVELPAHLNQDGIAWIECDSEHATEARALFERAGFSTRIMQDQYGSPRVLIVSFT